VIVRGVFEGRDVVQGLKSLTDYPIVSQAALRAHIRPICKPGISSNKLKEGGRKAGARERDLVGNIDRACNTYFKRV
jgi:hypothetical protein